MNLKRNELIIFEEILKMLSNINNQLKNLQIVTIQNGDGNVAVNNGNGTITMGNENKINNTNLE